MPQQKCLRVPQKRPKNETPNKDAEVENEYGDNPSNNDGRNPVFACVFPHMFIIKKQNKNNNMRTLLIHGCKNKLPAVHGEIRVMEKLVFLTNGVKNPWGIVLLC